MTGKSVDVNRSTEQVLDARCWLAARDFKPRGDKDCDNLFAAMPSLECKNILVEKVIMNDGQFRRGGCEPLNLMFIDQNKAHLNGIAPDDEKYKLIYIYIYLSIYTCICIHMLQVRR